MPTHQIRLRGPWKLVYYGAGVAQEVQGDLLIDGKSHSGYTRVEAKRRFHRPTNLSPDARVSLSIQALVPPQEIQLALVRTNIATDGKNLPFEFLSPALIRADITPVLGDYNELILEWACQHINLERFEAAVTIWIDDSEPTSPVDCERPKI